MSNKQLKIPKVDICSLSGSPGDEIILSRFGEYLERHHNLLAPHRHSFYHVLFFTEGGGSHTIDFKRFEVLPGQIYFMVPGQVHSWEFEGDVDGFIFNFSTSFFQSFLLNPDYLEDFSFLLGDPLQSVINLGEASREVVFQVFSSMLAEFLTKNTLRHDMIRSLFVQLLITVQRNKDASGSLLSSLSGNSLMRRYRSLVDKHFLTLRLPGEYAELLHVSPNHLNALCKENLDMSAGEVVRARIVLEAKRLLVNLDLTISEIAYQLNFSDNSYFTKFFKKETGVLPEAFRRQHMRGVA